MHTILLVEDNPADIGLVREALQEHGVECELIVITNGESAIDFIENVDQSQAPCPGLIILDLNLPRRTGMDVLKRVRASVRCGHVSIVVLTSSDNQKDKDQSAGLGASLYIRKPARLAEFMDLGRVFGSLLQGGPPATEPRA